MLSRQCPHRAGMATCTRPPCRTQRADFPHWAPTDRVPPSLPLTPSGAAFSGTAVRTTRGLRGSSRTAGDVGFYGVGIESIAVAPRGTPRGACAHNGARRSTDRSLSASSRDDAAGLGVSSACIALANRVCEPGTYGSSSRLGCGSERIVHSDPFHKRV